MCYYPVAGGVRVTRWEVAERFGTDARCREHLEKLRWPDGLVCVRCASQRVYLKRKRKQYECYDCRRRFSVLYKTIFQDSKIPLPAWFLAIHRVVGSAGSMSAKELRRELGISYKTAWFMVQRMRRLTAAPDRIDALRWILGASTGEDSTYRKRVFGGKAE